MCRLVGNVGRRTLLGMPLLDHDRRAAEGHVGGEHIARRAEHGIGRAKVAWLDLVRSPAELATMRSIKAALDPSGLLNPGVLLPVGV